MQYSSSAGPYHDTIVFMCARIASNLGYKAETESRVYNDLNKNPHIPDVVLTYKKKDKKRKKKVFVEVQSEITKSWLEQMHDQYRDQDWVLIPLKRITVQYTRDPKRYMERIYEEVLKYMDAGTELARHNNIDDDKPVKKKPLNDTAKEPCPICGKLYKNLKIHTYRCEKKNKGLGEKLADVSDSTNPDTVE